MTHATMTTNEAPRRATKSAPPITTKGGPKGPSLEVISLGRLLDHKFTTREHLIFPWLRQGESAMLWAAPGAGKTLLALTLAVAVAGGGTVAGWTSPKPRKVLVVDGEMNAEDLKDRAALLLETIEGIDKEAARQNLLILSRNWQDGSVDFPDLGQRQKDLTEHDRKVKIEAGQDRVFRTAQSYKAEFVILDNFSTLVEVADENDAASMTATLAFLLRFKTANIACMLVHHSGKTGTTYRGSSKLATTFEVIMGLHKENVAGSAGATGAAFRIHWEKFRGKPHEAVMDRVMALETDEAGVARWSITEAPETKMDVLMAAVETCQWSSGGELAKHLAWSTGEVSKIKTAAIKAGKTTPALWEGYLAEARENATTGDHTTDF